MEALELLPAAGERLMMQAGDVVIIAIAVALERGGAEMPWRTLTQFNYMHCIWSGHGDGCS